MKKEGRTGEDEKRQRTTKAGESEGEAKEARGRLLKNTIVKWRMKKDHTVQSLQLSLDMVHVARVGMKLWWYMENGAHRFPKDNFLTSIA